MTGIKDVAAKAHVSISTVSYVMSGKRSIGDGTKYAVLDAAKELGYRPRKATPDVMAFLTGQPYTEHTGQGGQSPASGTRARTKVLTLSSPVHEYTDYSNYAMFFFALASRAGHRNPGLRVWQGCAGVRVLLRRRCRRSGGHGDGRIFGDALGSSYRRRCEGVQLGRPHVHRASGLRQIVAAPEGKVVL